MEQRLFKKTGDMVSMLGFGLMRLPLKGKAESEIDEVAAEAMVDAAYAGGVNYFDTAYPYHGGASEPFLGRVLKKYPRNSFFLASKLPLWDITSYQKAEEIFEEQLARCQVEYFDFYLLHAMNAKFLTKVKELRLYKFLEQKRQEGKIRNIGFSFHDAPPVLTKICNSFQWDFAQIQLNYLDWDMIGSKFLYRTLERKGIPCVVMEPLRGGRLVNLGPAATAILQKAAPNSSIASWSFRHLTSLPNVLCVLSGMSDIQQVKDNIATLTNPVPLSDAQAAALKKAAAVFKKSALLPCTACRYCMPCPRGVDIPGMMKLYNDCAFDGGPGNLREKYSKLPAEERAGNCVSCKNCEKTCPQKLPIAELMHKIDATGQRP